MKYSLKEVHDNLFSEDRGNSIQDFVSQTFEILNSNSVIMPINYVVDENTAKTMQIQFSYKTLINYSFYSMCENNITINDISRIFDTKKKSSNTLSIDTNIDPRSLTIDIPDNDQLDYDDQISNDNIRLAAGKNLKGNRLLENNTSDKFDVVAATQFITNNFTNPGKISGSVRELIASRSINEFKGWLFYFLYKKFVDTPSHYPGNETIQESVTEIIKYFQAKLEGSAQTALTVNFGALFEEVLREAVFKSLSTSNRSYKKFELNIDHASKKSAIALLYCCNGLFEDDANYKSAIYEELKKDNKISDESYKKDFQNIRFRDGETVGEVSRSRLLASEVENIIHQYSVVLDISKQDMFIEDFEADSKFTVQKNAQFDFIVRDINIEETNKNIGLFDLKATNKDSTSKPIRKAATGNNDGTKNSALGFINDIVKQLNEINPNIGIELFSLIQIEYKLDFDPTNDFEISIESIQNIYSPAQASFLYSNNKDHFYLSYTSDKKLNYYYSNSESDKDHVQNNNDLIEKTMSDNPRLFLDNVIKEPIEIQQIKKIKSNKVLNDFINNVVRLYENYLSVENVLNTSFVAATHSVISNLYFITEPKFYDLIDDVNKMEYDDFCKKYNDPSKKIRIENLQLTKDIFYNAHDDDLFDPINLVKHLFEFAIDDSKQRNLKDKLDDAKQKQHRIKVTNILVAPYSGSNRIDNQKEFYTACSSNKKATNDTSIVPRDKSSLDVGKIIEKIKQEKGEDVSETAPSHEFFMQAKDARRQAIQNTFNFKNEILCHRENRKKVLKEVYSHLFKKKSLNEGGLAGHMMHPYEALDMTIRQIIDRIKEYGVPQSIIEKVDGQNLFFTVEQDGTLMFARNKEDMTHDDLIEKFTNHPAEVPFVTGGNAIKKGVDQWLTSAGAFGQQEILDIFHPDGEARSFINFEIMHKDHPNQIEYGENYIVFHSIVDFIDNRESVYSSNNSARLNKLINLMKPGIESSGYTLASNRTVELNKLTNIQISDYISQIREIANSLDISEDEFLGDGVQKQIQKKINELGVTISEDALNILYDFALYGEDKRGNNIKSKDFTKLMDKEDVAKLRSIGLTSANKALSVVLKILSPFKDVFVDLGIDLLDGVPSSYMSQEVDLANIDTLREKLQTAMDDLESYMISTPESDWDALVIRLKPHYDKVNNVGVYNAISTSVEGGVYDYQGDLLKVTGGFAPMNQILGAAYRDKKGIFPSFKEKFMQQESNRRSLKTIFNSIF